MIRRVSRLDLHISDGVVISILSCFGEMERSMGGGRCHNGLRLKVQNVYFQITRGFIFRNRRSGSVPAREVSVKRERDYV